MKPKKTTLLLGGVIVCLLSCGLLGGAAFWAGTSIDSQAKNLKTNLDEAEQHGILISMDQLAHVPDVESLDARKDLEAAFALWQDSPSEARQDLVRLSRRILMGRSGARAYDSHEAAIARFPGLMEHLDAAAMKPDFGVPKPESWNEKEHQSFWAFCRDMIRVLSAQAVLLGFRDDLEGAERQLSKAARITRHLGTQKSYTPIYRQGTSELDVQRALVRLNYAGNIEPRAYAAFIARQQERLGPLPSAREIMQAELPLVLNQLDEHGKRQLDRVPWGDMFNAAGQSGATEIWVRYVKKLPTDPEDIEGAERVLIAMDKEAEETPFYGVYVNNYDRMAPVFRDLLARRRLAQLAIAVLEKRIGQRTSLPELIDPHNGKPIQIIETPDETILFSVGRDLQDNSARDREPQDSSGTQYDILFRVMKPRN